MAAFFRLLALSLLFSVALPAAADPAIDKKPESTGVEAGANQLPGTVKETVGKSDLDGQKELLLQKIDSNRKLAQKDIKQLETRIDAANKRIDDQNDRVGDIGLDIAIFGAVITLLLAIGGLFGYFAAGR